MTRTRLNLSPAQFGPVATEIARCGEFRVSAFAFPSGSLALRVENAAGHVVILPYQGQQVWDACFNGRSLRMKSMFGAPRPTQDFLRTYGALLIHCGATAVGPPGPEDDHPPHGELPNAPMDRAWIEIGEDGVTIGGDYRYTVAFQTDYVFRPSVELRSGSTLLEASVEIENLKRSEMELFYLAHINFRAVDGMTLRDNAAGLRVRMDMPAHVPEVGDLGRRLAALNEAPHLHRTLAAGERYDPEIVLFMDFEQRTALCLAEHPEGFADFVRYDRAVLPSALRWISRTEDQDCLGLVLPSTSEGEGRAKERRKGKAVKLAGRAVWRCSYTFGCLDPAETRDLARAHALV